jgi:hypothetical protein
MGEGRRRSLRGELSESQSQGCGPDFFRGAPQDQEDLPVGIGRIVDQGQGRTCKRWKQAGKGRKRGGGEQDKISGGKRPQINGNPHRNRESQGGILAFYAEPGGRIPGGFEKLDVAVSYKKWDGSDPGHGVIEKGKGEIGEPAGKMDPDPGQGDLGCRIDMDEMAGVNR